MALCLERVYIPAARFVPVAIPAPVCRPAMLRAGSRWSATQIKGLTWIQVCPLFNRSPAR